MKWNRIPSSWAEASPSSPSAPDCALHPAPSASESHAQSGGGISHSDGKKTTNQILQPKTEGSIILFKSKCNLKCRHQGKRSTVRLYICVTDLHLLKFSDVGVALQLQVSHLVLMFLMLMESFILLSLVLLSSKLLEIKQKTPSGLNTSLIPLILTKLPDRGSDLFDLLSVLLWCSCASDPQALFKHRHTRLGFTALDLGQPSSFLCLPVLHLLYQPLVITLHLLHLLMTRRVGITMSGYKTYQSLIHWID